MDRDNICKRIEDSVKKALEYLKVKEIKVDDTFCVCLPKKYFNIIDEKARSQFKFLHKKDEEYFGATIEGLLVLEDKQLKGKYFEITSLKKTDNDEFTALVFFHGYFGEKDGR